MKKFTAVALVTAALAAAPLAPAHAEGWRHGGPGFHHGGGYGGGEFRHGGHRGGEFHHRYRRHGGDGWPLFGVIAGVTGAAILASSMHDAPPPPPAPVYVAPAPVVYSPPVVQRTVVYPERSYTTTYYGY